MKLEDVRIGMTVVDKFGNEYVVEAIDEDDESMPVCLKLIKFACVIVVQTFGDVIRFNNNDQCYWIYESIEKAIEDDCYLDCITVESLKLKDD